MPNTACTAAVIHACTHTHTQTQTHTHTRRHKHMRAYTRANKGTRGLGQEPVKILSGVVSTYARVCVCVYVCVHACVRLYFLGWAHFPPVPPVFGLLSTVTICVCVSCFRQEMQKAIQEIQICNLHPQWLSSLFCLPLLNSKWNHEHLSPAVP